MAYMALYFKVKQPARAKNHHQTNYIQVSIIGFVEIRQKDYKCQNFSGAMVHITQYFY